MKCMRCLNHNLQHDTSENPSESPTSTTLCETKHISGWGYILMTCRQSSRCWNTSYMYEADLLRVWSEWGASIITYSMIQVRNQENLLLPHLTVRPSIYQVGVASLWPVAKVAGAETLNICLKKTCFEYEVCEVSEWDVTVQPHGKSRWITYSHLWLWDQA
jgi:hypothetical protein